MIFDSHNIRIVSHQPFAGRRDAVRNDHDIASKTLIFEYMESRLRVSETDQGRELQAQVDDLRELLIAYQSGAVTEDHQD